MLIVALLVAQRPPASLFFFRSFRGRLQLQVPSRKSGESESIPISSTSYQWHSITNNCNLFQGSSHIADGRKAAAAGLADPMTELANHVGYHYRLVNVNLFGDRVGIVFTIFSDEIIPLSSEH